MKSSKKAAKKLKKGMSLVEVMIWVTIAGIVTGTVAIGSTRLVNNAKINTAKNAINTFSTALVQYKEDNGLFPTAEDGLKILIDEKYINLQAKDGQILDPWKNPYVYESINEGEGFVIKSLGSDKKEGGTSTRADIVFEQSTDDFDMD